MWLAAATAARGDVYWSVPFGDWLGAANWGGAAPGPIDDAYIINGGTASVSTIDTAATCLDLQLGDPNSTAGGGVQMSGGNLAAISSEILGNLGPGTFNQSGGLNTANLISVGDGSSSSGYYALNGSGVLNTTELYVGNYGSGTFIQSGGVGVVADTLYVGVTSTGNGVYNLSGGSLWAANEQLGAPFVVTGSFAGSGTFAQSGGTHTVANALTLNGGGTYNLSGGVLRLSSIQGSSGTFNFSGGTLATGPGFNAQQDMTLSGSGNINTSGNAAVFSGAFLGTGGLYVFGGGTLALAGSSSFSGSTLADGATTILLANAYSLPNSTLTLTAGSGGLAFDTVGGSNTTFYLGGLSGSGSGSLVDNSGAALELNVGGNGSNSTFSGAGRARGAA